MKRLMVFLLYIIIILLVYATWAKLKFESRERRAYEILKKYNENESLETGLLRVDSFNEYGAAVMEENSVNNNAEANVNAGIETDDKLTVSADVNANDTIDVDFDANVDDKYKAIGILEITKIDIKYPILDKTTEESLEISVTAYAGKINAVGNFVIAGHNYLNGFAFGKLKQIRECDTFTINGTDYKVFDIFIVNPTAVQKVVDQHTNGEKWVTLFTCTNGGKDRLVVRARAI